MEYHVSNKPLKTVFAWREESGVFSLYQPILHLDFGCIIDNTSTNTAKHISAIFHKYYKNILETTTDLKHHTKVVLFWRNPYQRIISEFLNKDYCPTDDQFSLDLFVENLDQTDINASLNTYRTFRQKNSNLKEHIVLLPNSLLPANRLFHTSSAIHVLYQFLWREKAYDAIKFLYTSTTPTLDLHNDMYKHVREKFLSKDFINKINQKISPELEFFKSKQINFNHDL